MSPEDYPGLFQAADSTSLMSQKIYMVMQLLYLGSLILGSILGITSFTNICNIQPHLYTATAIILAIGLFILWITRARRDDKIWFDCRAIAESVKTATWRFMMGAPPFKDVDSVEERFVDELKEIRLARPDCAKPIATSINAEAAAITAFMKQVRTYSFEDRKQLYIQDRLRDQKLWYSQKANKNARYGTFWFWVIVILQVTAVTMAIIQITVEEIGLYFIPVLTTIAATIAAWSQMKRYDELAKSYSLAAQELSELEAIADSLTEEDNFLKFVEQVEETISREHTMWCARRDVFLQ